MSNFAMIHLCASYRGSGDFFPRFRKLAREFEGVEDVFLVAGGKGENQSPAQSGAVLASAPVRFLDEIVGELQVLTRPESVGLVDFLARQLCIAVQSAAIHASNAALREHLAGLGAEVRERKLMERARGVIESRRLIPAGEGERLLKKVSGQSGKSLKELARGIVATANKNPWKFRREFWA